MAALLDGPLTPFLIAATLFALGTVGYLLLVSLVRRGYLGNG